MALHPLYFVDDLVNFHDSCSFSIFCSSCGSVEYICISPFDSPFLKSGIFLQNSYRENFVREVHNLCRKLRWGRRGEGAGQYGDCSVFFLSLQFLDTPPPPSPLIQPGDCQTKTRHSNLKI